MGVMDREGVGPGAQVGAFLMRHHAWMEGWYCSFCAALLFVSC